MMVALKLEIHRIRQFVYIFYVVTNGSFKFDIYQGGKIDTFYHHHGPLLHPPISHLFVDFVVVLVVLQLEEDDVDGVVGQPDGRAVRRQRVLQAEVLLGVKNSLGILVWDHKTLL